MKPLAAIAALMLALVASIHAADCVRWVQRTDVGAPEARAGHVMAYDSDRGVTVLFGGHRLTEEAFPELVYFNDTWEYDGTRWQRIAIDGPTPLWRTASAMCYDPVRKEMLLAGGYNGDEDDNEGYLYDFWSFRSTGPGRGIWTRKPDIPFDQRFIPNPSRQDNGRVGHSLVFSRRSGDAVLIGGDVRPDSDIGAPDIKRSSLVITWNGQRWYQGPLLFSEGPGPTFYEGPSFHAGVYDDDTGIVSVCGGSYNFGYRLTGASTTDWFDRDWSELIPVNRWVGTNEVYAPPRRGVPRLGTPIGTRRSPAAAYDTDRKCIVIFGGHLGAEDPPAPGTEDPGDRLDEATYFPLDDVVDAWLGYGAIRLRIPTPPARELHAMVYDTRRRVMVLFGGSRGLLSVKNDTWEYGLGAIPVLFVDGTPADAQDGSFTRPFNTVRQAAAVADAECLSRLSMANGEYQEGPLLIRKPLRLEARNGAVRIR